jgi:hypothetical protein
VVHSRERVLANAHHHLRVTSTPSRNATISDGSGASRTMPRTMSGQCGSGTSFGDKLTLTETDYKASRSPCDNALRRLDTYQGHVADADSLILSWGPGNQLLRRKH